MKITLKLWQENGQVKLYHSHKTRRIIAKVKAEKFLKTYIKVVYRKAESHSGRIEVFYNDGTYESKAELLQALAAFTEKSDCHIDLQSDPARNTE